MEPQLSRRDVWIAHFALREAMMVGWTSIGRTTARRTCRYSWSMWRTVSRLTGVSVHPTYSILDLKADCRGYKYVEERIKMLPEKPEPVFLGQILHKIACLSRIHASQPSCSFS